MVALRVIILAFLARLTYVTSQPISRISTSLIQHKPQCWYRLCDSCDPRLANPSESIHGSVASAESNSVVVRTARPTRADISV